VLKKHTRILIGVGCVVLLLVSWIIAISSKSDAEKQVELMRQAAELTKDGVYILAAPLLEEAAGYSAAHTLTAENELKRAYLELMNNSGYRQKYLDLLVKQMNDKNALPDVFEEAANYYFSITRIPDALSILKTGIEKTGDAGLVKIYEDKRYAYKASSFAYDYVAEIAGSAVQVQADGLWGLAGAEGVIIISCQYDKISTFCDGRAIVKKNGEIYSIDSNNNRLAKLHEDATDFGNYADHRVPLQIDGLWRRSTGDFQIGENAFQDIGMYCGGYAAAKSGGRWGVVNLDMEWLLTPEYDGIIQDELGRCYAQGAVFVRQGGEIYLFAGGIWTGGVYEDACPFSDEGFAAVKKNGKWGFIDATGTEMIDFAFDDARSFGQHLAAVKIGGLWGYASLSGKVAIVPSFLEAKSFSGGSAPVLTERGWQFITLLENNERE